MSDESKVREKYPKAEVSTPDLVQEGGQGGVYEQRGWTVYASGGLGAKVLGAGATLAAAWKSAAISVEREQHVKWASEVERWLLENGYTADATNPDRLVSQEDSDSWVQINRATGAVTFDGKGGEAYTSAMEAIR